MLDQKQIIDLAIQSGVIDSADTNSVSVFINPEYIDDLTRFAALVIEQEREACARLCEAHVGLLDDTGEGRFWAAKCAETIRKGRDKI